LDSLTRTVALPHILKLIVWTSIFHEPPKRVSKVLTASPRRPCDFSVEASGLPWLPCIWHRLARQGIAKASDGRCTRVKATHAEEKTRRRLARVGEKEQAARAGNRAPILRAGCRIAAVQEGGERRKERRGGRGERTGRRLRIWADGIQLLQLLPPSARPPIQLCPLDSWRLPLHRLAPTPPSLLPNPVAPAPSPIDLHLLPQFLFPNQSGRTPSTPLPTSSWFFFRLSAGTPPAVQHTDTGSFSFPILSLCQVATC